MRLVALTTTELPRTVPKMTEYSAIAAVSAHSVQQHSRSDWAVDCAKQWELRKQERSRVNIRYLHDVNDNHAGSLLNDADQFAYTVLRIRGVRFDEVLLLRDMLQPHPPTCNVFRKF